MHQFTNKDIQSIKDRVYYLIARAQRNPHSGSFLGQFVPTLITQHQSDEMMRYLNTHSMIDYYPLVTILQPFIDIARSQLKAEALAADAAAKKQRDQSVRAGFFGYSSDRKDGLSYDRGLYDIDYDRSY